MRVKPAFIDKYMGEMLKMMKYSFLLLEKISKYIWTRIISVILLTAEFNFKNPSRDVQVKSSNDEYTRHTQSKCSYYKFYEKSRAERGRITFLFDEKLTIQRWKKVLPLKT